MPKCFPVQTFEQYDGTNLSAIQTIANISGASVRTAPGDETALEIYADWMPTRTLPTDGVVVTPYLQTYPSLEAFQADYGIVEA